MLFTVTDERTRRHADLSRTGPNYLFEGYAIFNELLVLDHAARTANTAAERLYTLESLFAKLAIELLTSTKETSFEKGTVPPRPSASRSRPAKDRRDLPGVVCTI